MTAFKSLEHRCKRRAIAWRSVCRRGSTALLPRPDRASSRAWSMPEDWRGLVHDSHAERKCGTASDAWGTHVRHFELIGMGDKNWSETTAREQTGQLRPRLDVTRLRGQIRGVAHRTELTARAQHLENVLLALGFLTSYGSLVIAPSRWRHCQGLVLLLQDLADSVHEVCC